MPNWLNNDPNALWQDKIPLIQVDDPVLGGMGGPVNIPHQALADRTAHLKREVDGLKEGLVVTQEHVFELENRPAPECSSDPLPENIVLRDAAGRAQIITPAANDDICNKKYVDDAIGGISGADVTKAYVDSHIDADNAHGATSLATASRLVIRDANGRAQVATPSAAADIATKGYVDSVTNTNSGTISNFAASFVCA
ncbi:MAG: hypothetical protein LBB40_03300 [Holophagales bacterium]|jgi:hypothetical protein|nr:hypothetical protein [Holophagales bacterium]